MKKTLLYVDEDTSVRESVDKVLRSAGFETVLASGGLEAVALVETHLIDLVLLDLGLPHQIGWWICKHLAREHPNIPVIVITSGAERFKPALAPGAAAVIEKPLDALQLLQVILKFVGPKKDLSPARSKEVANQSEPSFPIPMETHGPAHV